MNDTLNLRLQDGTAIALIDVARSRLAAGGRGSLA
jgi:hypothetical protein